MKINTIRGENGSVSKVENSSLKKIRTKLVFQNLPGTLMQEWII